MLALVLALGFAMPEAIGASLLVTTINVVVAPTMRTARDGRMRTLAVCELAGAFVEVTCHDGRVDRGMTGGTVRDCCEGNRPG